MTHEVLEYVATFFAVFALDLCWVFYIRQIDKQNPMGAALWASFLFLTAAGAQISYVANPWLLVPAVAGAFFGTLVAVTRVQHGDEGV